MDDQFSCLLALLNATIAPGDRVFGTVAEGAGPGDDDDDEDSGSGGGSGGNIDPDDDEGYDEEDDDEDDEDPIRVSPSLHRWPGDTFESGARRSPAITR